MRLLTRRTLVLGSLPASYSQAAALERFEAEQAHMGTLFRIVLYAATGNAAQEALRQAFARVRQLDERLSDYRLESELSQLPQRAYPQPVAVSPDLFTLLSASQQLAGETQGAFDVTMGPLTRLWREARRDDRLPLLQEVREAQRLTGHNKLVLNPRRQTVRCLQAGMRLDLGGIAKGYAADQALQVLRRCGMPHALIAASGDIVVGEAPPGERAWTVHVQPQPWCQETLLLRNAAVSTAGDREQFIESGGKRYAHIIDPRTGQGTVGKPGVSVVAPTGCEADGIDTALVVMDPQRGRKWMERKRNVEAVFAWPDGRRMATRGFARWKA